MNERRKNIYVEKGYKDRRDYLKSLADEFEISYNIVASCADLLGPSEDFDGLITCLEDEFSQILF